MHVHPRDDTRDSFVCLYVAERHAHPKGRLRLLLITLQLHIRASVSLRIFVILLKQSFNKKQKTAERRTQRRPSATVSQITRQRDTHDLQASHVALATSAFSGGFREDA